MPVALSKLLQLVAFLAWAQAVPALGDTSLSGRAIMDAVAARHERLFEASHAEMTLIAADGHKTKRALRGYARREPDGRYRYLLTFTQPSSIAGVAMLAWDDPESGTDQWLFLPAAGAPKRVIGRARRDNFLDTGFALEDFRLGRRARHRYDRLADEEERGAPCFVIDVTQTDAAVSIQSGYARKRIYVDPRTYLIQRVDYYERGSERHLKTMLLLEVAEPVPGILRPKSYRMDNHKEQHATAITVLAWSFAEASVPAEMFAPRYLAARRHMR